jgi:hypothetical protein
MSAMAERRDETGQHLPGHNAVKVADIESQVMTSQVEQ